MPENLTPFPEAWLQDVIGYFQDLDFFKGPVTGWMDLPTLSAHIQQENRALLYPASPMFDQTPEWTRDQFVAICDPDRVWYVDTEVNNFESDQWYVKTLLDWARISRGSFRPQDISEQWLPERFDPECPESPDQPIVVRFTHDGSPSTTELLWCNGWFDYSLIKVVNSAIANTGCQFASVRSPCTQSAFLCCLTLDEIQKLKREKAWQFHEDLFALE